MKKFKPKLSTYFNVPNPGLKAYFAHTVSGNSDDYRPPFFKGKPRAEVLSEWQKVVDSLNVKNKWPTLYSYEMEMKSKVGPMSIQQPLKDRIRDIESYYTAIKTSSEPLMEEAIDAAIAFFSEAGPINLQSMRTTVEQMRLSTNSGSPEFGKRKRFVKETLESKYTSNGRLAWQDNYELCAVLGWRGQEGGLSPADVKQRVVWMMPFLLNIKELQFYQPAISAIQRHHLIPAYVSMDAVDQEVTKLFDTKRVDDVVICTDFSKFDQHFNLHMQEAAKKMLWELSSKTPEMEQWLQEVYPVKFNIPLICSEDLMFSGSHGMGSGSGGTNFDECMAHKALQYEAALRAGQTLNIHSMAYGDDGILTYPGIKVEDVIQTYGRHGQQMNPDKQYVSKHDCVVLRRWHSDSYRVNGTMVGVYSTFRALGRLLAQERFYDPEIWTKEMVELRYLSILENCKWSPYFYQFIDFVMKGDKYRLGLDLPGFFENLESLAQRSIDTITDFLGYTKTLQKSSSSTGINDWEVVKYIKSKKFR